MAPGHFAGQVGVITGAAAGIGRALAVRLAAQGARLVLIDRDAAGLAGTEALCRQAGADRVRTDVLDVTDRSGLAALADDVVADLGRVDLVLTLAGVIHHGGVLESAVADVERVVEVNFWGTVHTVTAFLPHLIASGGGHLVTLSSAFGLIATPGSSAYNASKFAVRGFTEALRQEMALAGLPVWVTCVVPGGVATSIVRNGTFASPELAPGVVARFERRLARTSPERAAELILRGVHRRRPRVLVGADARTVDLVVRLIGARYQDLLPRLVRRSSVARAGRDRRPGGQ